MGERPELSNPFTNGQIVGHDVDPEVYHQQEAKRGDPAFVMSRGQLLTFADNPWKWVMGVKDEGSRSTEWGNLMDCVVLSPDRFDTHFAVCPETYPATKNSTAVKSGECSVGDPLPWDGKAGYCKAWAKEQGAKQVVKSSLMDDADRAHEVLYTDSEIVKVIEQSQKQVLVTADYTHKQTGLTIKVKTLIDLLPIKGSAYDRCVVDLKTAACAAPRKWASDLFSYGYHVQAALYLDVLEAATGELERDQFHHIVQENSAPFYPMRHSVGDDLLRLGRETYIVALRKYCLCLAEQAWPGYEALPGQLVENGWHTASAPAWAIS